LTFGGTLTGVKQQDQIAYFRPLSIKIDSLHHVDDPREPAHRPLVYVIDAKLTGTVLLPRPLKSNMLRTLGMLRERSGVVSTTLQGGLMRSLKLVASSLAVFGLLSGPALAQDVDEDSGRAIKYKARTEIDFEGVDVSGDLIKPSGMLLMDVKRKQFNPLIRLREDFNTEMKQSVDEVK
jgi:hypothetical protein